MLVTCPYPILGAKMGVCQPPISRSEKGGVWATASGCAKLLVCEPAQGSKLLLKVCKIQACFPAHPSRKFQRYLPSGCRLLARAQAFDKHGYTKLRSASPCGPRTCLGSPCTQLPHSCHSVGAVVRSHLWLAPAFASSSPSYSSSARVEAAVDEVGLALVASL